MGVRNLYLRSIGSGSCFRKGSGLKYRTIQFSGGCNSGGRVSALQALCQEFESPQLHHEGVENLGACSSVG